jgi:hypothetical protein
MTRARATSPSMRWWRLRRSRARPDRGRRRHPAGRDHLRHAQRQGRAVRHREAFRRSRPALAGDDLRHHHRRLGPHAVGPDRRGLLELAAPRAADVFGLNCALGAKELRQYVEELSNVCDCFISAHPNAGLPNAFGGYDETPQMLADEIGEWASRAGQHRRRLLRHLARPHPRHCRGGEGHRRAVPQVAEEAAPVGPGAFNVGDDSRCS